MLDNNQQETMRSPNILGLTPTQRRMLAVLADGLSHSSQELHGCLSDDRQPVSHIHVHITGIRKLLRPRGEEVICQRLDGGTFYRWVRLSAPP
jgi:hypothetical protein